MGKTTQGYKAARLSHLQELQTCLAEKQQTLTLSSLRKTENEWMAQQKAHIKSLRIALGVLAGALVILTAAWVLL